MMRFIRQMTQKLLFVAGLGLCALSASAAPASPENGKEYATLERPQPVDSGKKIEVIEFFAYYCPHCNALEPLLADWVKKQGDNIVFKRVHVSDSRVLPQQKLFYTLEALGKVDELHAKVFHTFHVERNNRLMSDGDVLEFAVKSGIDKQKFVDVYNSFSVQSKLSRATQLMSAYQVDSWPKLAIDGRYVTSPVMAASGMGRVTEDAQNLAQIQVLDSLVSKIQREKNAPAAATPATSAASAAKAASKKK
ncbi:thiol:disulfide interchange protein DsbA/DsbL [Undibacterium sp. RuTC16W]|uniref:thiol:disulfide interchange protein DsbA/DsbL n=1 Tax=Undibacterium sp. RuTC16W TaxID=3413048 RepID=UPI003BF0ABDD